MRSSLTNVAGQVFDVAVIGAGVNGASTAQHLAAEGYSVLLVDKGDFASGSSSRSSRLLHCGLRYLAPGASMWEFVRHPGRFVTACRMAKAAMQSRAQFVATAPERVRPLTFCFPFYRDGPYAVWQIDMAFRLLGGLGPSGIPLDYRRLSAEEAAGMPLLSHLRRPEALNGVATFCEYQFDWPERVVLDAVLDAERLGARVCNYALVERISRVGDAWALDLRDTLGEDTTRVSVTARAIFNMAGIWIDQVNARVEGGDARRRITGTKGAHIVVRLPAECRNYGIVTLNRTQQPFYCVPWRGLHYFGPTESLYEGDPDDVRTEAAEIDELLAEANHLLPTLPLERSDVLYTWAGVRPLTYDPSQPMGARSRELHDLGADGLPNIFAMTAGPVMTHRSTGQQAVQALKPRLQPGGLPSALSYGARPLPGDPASPPLVNHEAGVGVADVRRAVTEEYAETLCDVMFRRIGTGWSEDLGRGAAPKVAEIMGKERGWSRERIDREIQAYLAFVEHQHPTA